MGTLDLFGAGLSPLRIVSGFFGVAEVVALYALIKAVFDRRTALLAALLLATFPPHVHFSRLGMAARGVVFGIIGVFLVIAARHANPAQARGVGGALHTLRQQPYGAALLAVVALGLIAYGCYQFILARYRRIEAA